MKSSAGGEERTFIRVAALVDTNVLVYVFDAAEPRKQRLKIPHQVVVEFVSVVTRPRPRSRGAPGKATPLLTPQSAYREAEEIVTAFEVLYPNEAMVRTALRGAAAYQFSWYDAHLWAYAEHYGLSQLLSEDFEHGRRYGSVRVVNPFL